MRRRRFLATLGVAAGLAGCSGLQNGQRSPDGTLTPAPVPEQTPGETPEPFEDGRLGSAAIGESDVGDRTLAISRINYTEFDVAVSVRFGERATTGHPVRLEAQLRSLRETTTEVPLEFPPFAPVTNLDRGRAFDREVLSTGDDDRPGPDRLYLVPANREGLADSVPRIELAGQGEQVWRLAEPIEPWYPDAVRMRAGQRLRETFHLVAPVNATAPPLGRYETSDGRAVATGITAWQTSAPGPRTDSRFGDANVPTLPHVSETQWFHRADAGTRVFLRPRSERVEPPATIAAMLHNHSRESATASSWSFYKLDGGRWYDLGPYLMTGVARPLAPGQRHTWRVAVAHDGDRPSGGFEPADAAFGYLGGGRYALAAGSGPAGQPAALFSLDAPALTVAPSDDVTTARDGSVLTVRSGRPPGDGDAESSVLVLERGAPAPTTETPSPSIVDQGGDGSLGRLIPEQVMHSRGLRNTLPFFEDGVETVRLETTATVTGRATRTVRLNTGASGFRFGGDAYRFHVESGSRSPNGGGTGTPVEPTGTPTRTDG